MSLFEVFLIGVGLSMDAFAVSVCKGLSMKKIKVSHLFICGAWFGFFQGFMPLIGYGGGRAFADIVDKYDHWIAFILLLFIGGNMIKGAISNEEEKVDNDLSARVMLLLAIATSIDALAVGVTFAFMNVNIISAVFLIGATTFVISAFGVKIGSIFGDKYKNKAEIIGGVILILIGLRILLQGIL